VPLRLAILFPQQEQNPSSDRHFRAFRPSVGPQDQTTTATAGLDRPETAMSIFSQFSLGIAIRDFGSFHLSKTAVSALITF